jgi:hypothetical protein
MSVFITPVEESDAGRRVLYGEPRGHAMIHRGLALEGYRASPHDTEYMLGLRRPIRAGH